MSLIAFHGQRAVKDAALAHLAGYARAGKIFQYGQGDGTGSGAFLPTVGSFHDYVYEVDLGIPLVLAHLENFIFHNLPADMSQKFLVDFLQCIPVGADLSDVSRRFAIWSLTNLDNGALSRVESEISRRRIQAVADAHAARETDPVVWMRLRAAAIDARSREVDSPAAFKSVNAAVHSAHGGAYASGHDSQLSAAAARSSVGGNAALSAESVLLAQALPLCQPLPPPRTSVPPKRSVCSKLADRLPGGKERAQQRALAAAQRSGRASARQAFDRDRVSASYAAIRQSYRRHHQEIAAQRLVTQVVAESQAAKLLALMASAPPAND